MMNESPNKICACALASLGTMFNDLHYVAFVDSGTNVPYNGFAQFSGGQVYDDAWDTSQPGLGDWSGFIADVINQGLVAEDPLEMIIRASAPPGTLVAVDSACGNNLLIDRLNESSLGTDAWSALAGGLDESHQGVRALDDATLNQVIPQYFIDLDDAILNNFTTDTNTCRAAFSYKTDAQTLEVTDLSNMNANQYVSIDWGDGSSESIMSNQSAEHVYSENNTYTVCVYNINNDVTACEVCKDITIAPTGIGAAASTLELSVYPNPASDILFVTLDGEQLEDAELQLINMVGKQVAACKILSGGRIDVSEVPNGVYFVQSVQGDNILISASVVNRR